jgi:hypothetical protein
MTQRIIEVFVDVTIEYQIEVSSSETCVHGIHHLIDILHLIVGTHLEVQIYNFVMISTLLRIATLSPRSNCKNGTHEQGKRSFHCILLLFVVCISSSLIERIETALGGRAFLGGKDTHFIALPQILTKKTRQYNYLRRCVMYRQAYLYARILNFDNNPSSIVL